MFSALARQAILACHSLMIAQLCITIIEQSFQFWPGLIGNYFRQPSSPQWAFDVPAPAFAVLLCIKRVEINNIPTDIEAFRVQFEFPGIAYPPLVYYCPRYILAVGYVGRTIEASLKEEVRAWITGKSRKNILMVEHGKNLHRKMRTLLQELPMNAFNLQLPPKVSEYETEIGLGRSTVFLEDANTVGITISTVDGYSFTQTFPRRRLPWPAELKIRLLEPYLESR